MPDTIIGFNLAARLPNLGLVSIAANGNPEESDIKVLDLVLCRHALMRSVKKALDKSHPEIVGISCMIFQYKTARKIAKWIKEVYDPNITIVFGGYYPTVCYHEFGPNYDGNYDINSNNACPWCDFVIRGEGEITFREFIHEWRNEKNYKQVLGLSWKDNEGLYHHNERRPNLDLSQLKPPDRSTRLITNGFHNAGLPGDVVETSRGCTNTCRFCSIASMYGRSLRLYSLDRVIKDIKECKKRGKKSILFIDDNITLRPERFENLCDMIIEEKLNMSFHVQASANGLLSRPNLIPKMGKAGFRIVFFGIENINKKDLKFFQKSIPLKKLKTLVKRLHKHGMLSFGGFILGNPEDNLANFEQNLQFAKMLDLDIPAWQIITPFPRTETREDLLKASLITNKYDYSKYTGIYANVKTKYLSPEKMNKELIRLYVRYYTPMWFIKRLFQARLWHFLPYALHVGWKNKHYILPAWHKLWSRRKAKEYQRKTEDNIIDEFNEIRNKREKLVNV
ncbi:MAG: radical SAM protein [Candidatus Lokiarchaeota archaeon]|nr:radical SAM protein [Candidatus Lokiarchaeota archaeon]